jgi:hypothetical protein
MSPEKKKYSFLDETLKRWPVITLGIAIAWFILSNQFESKEIAIETNAKIDRILLIVDKDKEAVNTRFVNVEATTNEQKVLINELDKKVFAMMELYKKQIKKEEE